MISRLQRSTLRRMFCREPCRWSYHSRLRREKNAQERKEVCPVCKAGFTPTKKGHEICTKACKQRAYRKRKNEAREKQQ
jgi:hypothetical protein